jgi:hypothetical protein
LFNDLLKLLISDGFYNDLLFIEMLLALLPNARYPEIPLVLAHSIKTPTMKYRFMVLKKRLNENLAPRTSCITPLYSYLRAETGFLLAAW